MYINRDHEFNLIDSFISEGVQLIFISVKECSGFTSFLDEKLANYKTYHIEYNKDSYQSLIEKILHKMSPSDIKKIENIMNQKYGEYEKKLLSSLAEQIIPYFGNTLSTLNEGKKGFKLYDANYQIFSSVLIEFLTETSKTNRIGILLDGAQYINETDYNFIKELLNIKNIYIILDYSRHSRESG